MSIDFSQTADTELQRRVSNGLLEVLAGLTTPVGKGSKEEYLRINCSHALVRWYYGDGSVTGPRLEKAIDVATQANDTRTQENLDEWVRKAWEKFSPLYPCSSVSTAS